ncbi:nuclear transport factor 2 family protein [Pseudomonas putida]
MTRTIIFALALAALAAPAAQAATPENAEQNRTLVVDFYNRFFNQHQVAEAAQMVGPDYKQHNPQVPDGKAPFVNFFTDYFNKFPQASSRIVRSAVDGDLVWLHNFSQSGPADRGRAIVNIFRVKDGKIVEHWDVIQAVPEQSANGNTMF